MAAPDALIVKNINSPLNSGSPGDDVCEAADEALHQALMLMVR